MALLRSSRFVSCSASGADWREAARTALKALEDEKPDDGAFTFGLLYVSQELAGDYGSLVNLFRSVLGIENWAGCAGYDVCALEEQETPGLSVMLCALAEEDFCLFSPEDADSQQRARDFEAMLGLVHLAPAADQDLPTALRDLRRQQGGFVLGGLPAGPMVAGGVYERGVGGVLFAPEIEVASTLSQGCRPVGEAHEISRAYEDVVAELDDRPALEVFEQEIRDFVMEQVEGSGAEMTQPDSTHEALRLLMGGRIHVGISVSESDQKDYMVRALTDIDQENGALHIAHNCAPGEHLFFVRRDEESLLEDLSRQILKMRKRVERERGSFAPQAAHYISCAARLEAGKNSEMQVIRDIIGDVPLTGFYAGGEISNGRLYSFTGILTLFF